MLFLLYRERRKRKAMEAGSGMVNEKQHPWQAGPGAEHTYERPPQEMGAYDQQDGKYHMRGEMDGQGRPQELSSAATTQHG